MININSFLKFFRRKLTIHVVNKDFLTLKKNIKLSTTPIVGEKIYFEKEKIYKIIEVIHYYDKIQVIWIVVEEIGVPATRDPFIESTLSKE